MGLPPCASAGRLPSADGLNDVRAGAAGEFNRLAPTELPGSPGRDWRYPGLTVGETSRRLGGAETVGRPGRR